MKMRILFVLLLSLILASGNLLIGSWSSADDAALIPGLVATLRGHSEALYAVAFSPNGNEVATASFDKTVKVWEVATGKEIKTLAGPAGHQNLVLSVAYSPDGQLLASGSQDNTAKIW